MKIYGTAKGGALSTKDFGVAFKEVPSECFDTNSEDTGGSAGGGWGLSATSFPLSLGQSFISGHQLIGKEILTLTEWLQISGTNLGTTTMYAYLWNGAGTPSTPADYRAVSDGVSSSTIGSTGFTEATFTFSSPATLQANDYLSISLPTVSGSSINYMSDGSAYETNTTAQEFRSSWTQKSFGNRFKVKYTC